MGRHAGRSFDCRGKDAIAAICKVPKSDDEEGDLPEEGPIESDGTPPAASNQGDKRLRQRNDLRRDLARILASPGRSFTST